MHLDLAVKGAQHKQAIASKHDAIGMKKVESLRTKAGKNILAVRDAADQKIAEASQIIKQRRAKELEDMLDEQGKIVRTKEQEVATAKIALDVENKSLRAMIKEIYEKKENIKRRLALEVKVEKELNPLVIDLRGTIVDQ
jgi:hypothetical protein